MHHMHEFKHETQVQIVVAIMTIHNFIRLNVEMDIDLIFIKMKIKPLTMLIIIDQLTLII